MSIFRKNRVMNFDMEITGEVVLTIRRWSFRNKNQLPFFMVWDEFWVGNEVVDARVVFNSLDWIGF